MNSESHESSSSRPEGSAPKSTRQTLDELSANLTEAILQGGRHARRAFAEGLPKVKSECAQGLYEVAYAVGYAATFGVSILREATPESLSKGFREGSVSGRRAAEEAVRQRRESAAREAEPPTTGEVDGAWA